MSHARDIHKLLLANFRFIETIMKLARHTQFPIYGSVKQRTYTENYIYAEENCVLGSGAVWSGSNYRLSDERALFFFCSKDGCRYWLFYLEDGGYVFFQNVGKFVPDYTASHSRRRCSSWSPLWQPHIWVISTLYFACERAARVWAQRFTDWHEMCTSHVMLFKPLKKFALRRKITRSQPSPF